MKRIIIPLLLFCVLCFSSPSYSQSLLIHGETELVVTKLPFEISYPLPANFYWWTVPNGWTVKEEKGKLFVISAPKGRAEVKLTTWHIDFDKKTSEERKTSLTFSIGEVGKPKDPPIDPPIDPIPPGKEEYFFMVVREKDPPDLNFTRLVSDPTWRTLAPHQMRDYNKKEAEELGARIVVGQKYPCVVGLYKQPNGKYKQKAVFNAPASSEEIKDLPSKMR